MNLEIPFEITCCQAQSNTSQFDPLPHWLYFDDGWFAGSSVSYYLEIVAQNDDSSSRTVKLIDDDGTPSELCTVTVSAGVGSPTRQARVAFTPNSGGDYYSLRLEGTTSDNQLIVYNARIIVVITGAVKCAVSLMQGNRANYADTHWTYIGDSAGAYQEDPQSALGQYMANFIFTNSWFAGEGGVTYDLHCRIYNNLNSREQGVRLYNKDDSTVVSSSTVTTGVVASGWYDVRSQPAFASGDDGDRITVQVMRNGSGTAYFYTCSLVAIITLPTSVPVYFDLGRNEGGGFFDTDLITARRAKINKSAYSGDSVQSFLESCVWDRVAGHAQEFALHDQGTSESSSTPNALATRLNPTSEVEKHGVYRSANMYSELDDGDRYIPGGYSGTDDIKFSNFYLIILVQEPMLDASSLHDSLEVVADSLYGELHIHFTGSVHDSIESPYDTVWAEIYTHIAASLHDSITAADSLSGILSGNIQVQIGDSIQVVADSLFSVEAYFADQHEMVSTVEVEKKDGTKLYWAPEWVRHPNRFYEARIKSYGVVSRSIAVPAGIVQVGGGAITLTDPANELGGTIAPKTMMKAKLRAKIGPIGAHHSAFMHMFSREISNIAKPGDGLWSIQHRDFIFDFLKQDVETLINTTLYPNLPEASKGKFSPIVLGEVTGLGRGHIPAILVDEDEHRYNAVRHKVKAITEVYEVTGRTEGKLREPVQAFRSRRREVVVEDEPGSGHTLISPSEYEVVYVDIADGGDSRTYLVFNSAREHPIAFNCQGFSYTGATMDVTNFSDVVLATFKTFPEIITVDDINWSSFESVAEKIDALGWAAAGAVVRQTTYWQMLTQVLKSFNGQLATDRRDRVLLSFAAPTDEPVMELDDIMHLFGGSVRQSIAEPTFNQIPYKFKRNYVEGDWEFEEEFDNEEDQTALGEVVASPDLLLYWVRDFNQALQVAADYAGYYDLNSFQFEGEVPLIPTLDKLELGELAQVSHYAGIAEGGYSGEEFRLTRLDARWDEMKYYFKGIRKLSPPSFTTGTLDGDYAANSRVGPYRLGGTSEFFGIFRKGQSPNYRRKLECWHSPDWGETWEILDEANEPSGSELITTFDSIQVGNYLHCVMQYSSDDNQVLYSIFDMVAQEWTTVNEVVVANPDTGGHGTHTAVSIDFRDPSGEPVIFFLGDMEDVDGSDFDRCYYTIKQGDSWSTPVVVCETGVEYDFWPCRAVATSGDVINFFYRKSAFVGGSYDFMRVMGAGLGFGSEQQIQHYGLVGWPAGLNFGVPATYWDGDNQYIIIGSIDNADPWVRVYSAGGSPIPEHDIKLSEDLPWYGNFTNGNPGISMATFGSKVHCCLSLRYSITSTQRKDLHTEAVIASGLPPNLEGSDDQEWSAQDRMSPIYAYPEEEGGGDGGQINVFRVFSTEMIASFHLGDGVVVFELQSLASLPRTGS